MDNNEAKKIMDEIVIKKNHYQIVGEINSYIYKVKKDDKEYLFYDISNNVEGFFDFRYANKRLKVAGITIPKVFVLDKKSHYVILENVKGDTVFDELRNHDLDEKIFEQIFTLNFKARSNGLRLDFHPDNFIVCDGKLYYSSFTFTGYNRDEDFTQKEIRLWFYTNEYKNLLIERGLPIDQSRLKNEYERNKEIVLTVVKYFR